MADYKIPIEQSPVNYTPTAGDEIVDHLSGIDTALASVTSAYTAGQLVCIGHEGIPANMLDCDGSAVSRTTYATLYTAIGVMYGNGDGTTTFNVPDMQGWHMRGFGGGTDPDSGSRGDRGDGTTGNAVGTYQGHATNSHAHTFIRDSNNKTTASGGNVTGSGGNDLTNGASTGGGSESRADNVYVRMAIVFEA